MTSLLKRNKENPFKIRFFGGKTDVRSHRAEVHEYVQAGLSLLINNTFNKLRNLQLAFVPVLSLYFLLEYFKQSANKCRILTL